MSNEIILCLLPSFGLSLSISAIVWYCLIHIVQSNIALKYALITGVISGIFIYFIYNLSFKRNNCS